MDEIYEKWKILRNLFDNSRIADEILSFSIVNKWVTYDINFSFYPFQVSFPELKLLCTI
jgi:hypothetical protein